ncbi:MAG: CotH kinase family protein, partial [Chlorobi bacterium]|nr:CotH kinase family protein [Chlorobiota bacterium]
MENIFENFSEDIYIPVTMTHDDVTIDDVRMRIRGDGTRVFRKKSLKFKFDSEPFFDGREVVNFNAEFEDRSYLRQHLATRLFKLSGQVCYSTEYARLYINDKFMGLFLIIENVGEQFLEANDMNKNCNIYKATYDGACLSVWDGVFFHWEKKINENGDRDDLTQFIKGINEVPDEDYKAFISDKMNYDEMLNIIAMNIMLVNASTYYHNYYMYHDLDTDKWSYLPWDTDKTFSKFGSGVMYSSNRAKPSNPLFHRAMMVEEVFADVQSRIEEISTDFFNNDYLQAVRDSLVEVLRPSVLEDDQDDIPDEAEWLERVDNDHHFIKNRFNLISKQYGEVPKLFKVIPSNEVFTGDVTLKWHPAVSPNGSPLQYKIYHSRHLQMLKDVEETELFDDTTYTFKAEDLEERTYYWYVVCYDGKYEVWGIDNFNYFTYKTGTKPACEISKNTTFSKDKSPYIIENCNLTIKPGVKLTVEAGAEIRLADTSDIVIQGEMICLGTEDEPISIRTIDSPNNNHRLIFKDATGVNKFNYVNFDEVKFFSTVSDLEISNCNFIIDENISEDDIFKIYEGDWTFRNNIVRSNGTGEGIVLSYSDAITEGNEFYNCPDAVEYITVEDGLIRGNLIVNSPDDAIDLNGCQ